MSENRAGTQESAQISNMGVIDIASGDFVMEYPSCIKNDGDEPVELEVQLWAMPDGEYVKTTFDIGWNPEIVKCVKQKNGTLNLKWGY